uniref:MADF domain-containing protein n=1 Tax=Caenorhabditis japonica TaxID=281687 RepID=A0A8R1IM00_CAEJA
MSAPFTPESKFHRHYPIVVKQEMLPAREPSPSPPPYMIPRSITPIPDVRPGTETYDMPTYRRISQHHSLPDAQTRDDVKKTLFDLIYKHPKMWDGVKLKTSLKQWEDIGLELWKRLDIVVSVDQMKLAWRVARDGIRRKLRSCIETHKMGPAETENTFLKWEVYGHIRFLRARYATYEEELRKEFINGETADADVIREAERDEDDVIFEGYHAPIESGSDTVPDAPTYIDYASPGQSQISVPTDPMIQIARNQMCQPYTPISHMPNHQIPQVSEEVVEQLEANAALLPCSPNFTDDGLLKFDIKSSRKRTAADQLPSDSDLTAQHIGHEVKRAFRQYPAKESLIRQSFFTLLMAIDDEEADYQNMADIFNDLAAQCNAKAASRVKRLAQNPVNPQ